MNSSYVDASPERSRRLNSVALEHAVLCAECDVVSDSPHDTCLVCGSRSLFNIARMFGGKLPLNRAALIPAETLDLRRDVVLGFPTRHASRAKASG